MYLYEKSDHAFVRNRFILFIVWVGIEPPDPSIFNLYTKFLINYRGKEKFINIPMTLFPHPPPQHLPNLPHFNHKPIMAVN